MGEEVIDTSTLNRRNSKGVYLAKEQGACRLKFNLYVYKRLEQKGFPKHEISRIIGCDDFRASRYFSVVAPYALKLYLLDTGSPIDDDFRLNLKSSSVSVLPFHYKGSLCLQGK